MAKKKAEKRPDNEIEIRLEREHYAALKSAADREGLTVKELALSIISEQVGKKKGFYSGVNFVLQALDELAKRKGE